MENFREHQVQRGRRFRLAEPEPYRLPYATLGFEFTEPVPAAARKISGLVARDFRSHEP